MTGTKSVISKLEVTYRIMRSTQLGTRAVEWLCTWYVRRYYKTEYFSTQTIGYRRFETK
jgi:hypothetical protein